MRTALSRSSDAGARVRWALSSLNSLSGPVSSHWGSMSCMKFRRGRLPSAPSLRPNSRMFFRLPRFSKSTVFSSRLIYFGGYGYKLMADPDERSRSFIVHKTLWVEQVEMGWNNEVHIFDPKHSSWSEPQTHGHAPALRAGHASMTIGCKGYICGGRVKRWQTTQQLQLSCQSEAGADGRCEDLLETTWPSSDLTARPCLASAASERHFSPGSPEQTALHKMLFLPAAALCCLCSALVAMAAELIQDDLTLTRRVGEEVSFSCGQTHLCDYSGRVVWLQKKETFSLILDINMNDGKIYTGYGHSQVDDFSVERKQNVSELKIREVKLSHSASYYCRCGKKVKNDPHSEK